MRLIRWLRSIALATVIYNGIRTGAQPSAFDEIAISNISLNELLASGPRASQQLLNGSCGTECIACLERTAPKIAELTLRLLEANDGDDFKIIQLEENARSIPIFPEQERLLRNSPLTEKALTALLLKIVESNHWLERLSSTGRTLPPAIVVKYDDPPARPEHWADPTNRSAKSGVPKIAGRLVSRDRSSKQQYGTTLQPVLEPRATDVALNSELRRFRDEQSYEPRYQTAEEPRQNFTTNASSGKFDVSTEKHDTSTIRLEERYTTTASSEKPYHKTGRSNIAWPTPTGTDFAMVARDSSPEQPDDQRHPKSIWAKEQDGTTVRPAEWYYTTDTRSKKFFTASVGPEEDFTTTAWPRDRYEITKKQEETHTATVWSEETLTSAGQPIVVPTVASLELLSKGLNSEQPGKKFQGDTIAGSAMYSGLTPIITRKSSTASITVQPQNLSGASTSSPLSTAGSPLWGTGLLEAMQGSIAPVDNDKLLQSSGDAIEHSDLSTDEADVTALNGSIVTPEVKVEVTPNKRVLVTLPDGVVYPVPESLDSLVAAIDPRQLKAVVSQLKVFGLPIEFHSNHLVMAKGSVSKSDALRIEFILWSTNQTANSVSVYFAGNRYQLPEQMDAFANQLKGRPRADIRAVVRGLQRYNLPQGLDTEPLVRLMDKRDEAATVTTLMPDVLGLSGDDTISFATSPESGEVGDSVPHRLTAPIGVGGIVLEFAGRRFRLPDEIELLNRVITTTESRENLLKHMRKVGIPAVIVNNRLAIDQAAVLTSTKSRQRPVRLRIYTVDGRPSKVLIRAEGSEFELPKDQTLFNRFIKNSSVLIYEIIKVLSHYSIPVTFDEDTGDLTVQLNSRSTNNTHLSYQVTINGEQYRLPDQWPELETAIYRGTIHQPDQLIKLFIRYNLDVPQYVLNAIKLVKQQKDRPTGNPLAISIVNQPQSLPGQLVLSFRGITLALPQDSQMLSQLITDENALAELRDIALSANALSRRHGNSLWVETPDGLIKVDLNLTQTPTDIGGDFVSEEGRDRWRFMPYRVSTTESSNFIKVEVADGNEHLLPGDETELEDSIQRAGKPSRLVDALQANGISVNLKNQYLDLSWGQIRTKLRINSIRPQPMASLPKAKRKMGIRARGAPGNFMYTITLADGRSLTLPAQWEQLQEMVRNGKLRLNVLLRLFDMSRINIGHRRSEDGSWSVVLNGKAYTLDDQPQ
ncbi:uncharacterized protein LOC111245279 isoform X2 [Varroa destructor]|nr:uncharacterized protein LOC111245279 isoform X2 [Varroa destructor]XP_022649166.1 uncharacterized protein LOC111245279 isoform X2 [Varroa destructor]